MVKREFGPEYYKYGNALTLDPGYIKQNESGWKITGEICEDYVYWVNYFEAYHKDYGLLKGDFEQFIEAESEEAIVDFLQHHPPTNWDYQDI